MLQSDKEILEFIKEQAERWGKVSLFEIMQETENPFTAYNACHRLELSGDIFRRRGEEEGLEIYYYVRL
jgi:hypothetical protein